MANQYSITVSNGADAVLKRCKDSGAKISQVISSCIEMLGYDAVMMIAMKQRILSDYMNKEDE
tara:strand:+ start:516 stop:704 length:189 start_codon:yes stop_codon:yes gene_type:complete